MKNQLFFVITAGLIGAAAVSTAATLFNSITIVGAYMKSSWRLELTSYCYLISVIITWSKEKDHYIQLLKNDWKKLILSGAFLGLHFCFWTLSLDLTSVAHSLLFLCSSPFFVIAYYIIRCNHIKYQKTVGVVIGFIGIVILCIEGNNSEGSTWYGDLVALGGAFAIWFNYVVSEDLMRGAPWFFLWVMSSVAAIFCWTASIIEGLAIGEGQSRLFQTFEYFSEFQGIYAACLGIGVGFIGNGMFYFLLKHTSPLVINVIFTFEPVTGTIFAWAFGFQKDPSIYTWIGGAIICVGNLIVILYSELKKENIEA